MIFPGTWLHFLLKKIEREEEFKQPQHKDKDLFGSIGSLFNKLASSKPSLSTQEQASSGIRIPFRHVEPDSDRNWSLGAYVLLADDAPLRSNLEAVPLSQQRRFSAGEKPAEIQDAKLQKGQLIANFQRKQSNVTLICFGPPIQLICQLEALPDMAQVNEVLEHPYILWELIMYNLSVALDNEMTSLIEVFGTEQRVGYASRVARETKINY
jgi:hypothetical protein